MKWMGIGALIDASWEDYRKSLGDFLRITGWLLVFVAVHIVAVAFYPIGGQALDRDLTNSEVVGVILFLLNALILLPVISIWSVHALIRAIDTRAQGNRVGMRSVSREAWKNFFPQIWVRILTGVTYIVGAAIPLGVMFLVTNVLGGILPYGISLVLLLLGLALFVIPLALLIHLAFVFFEFVLEGKRGWQAVHHSAVRVHKNFWPVAWRLIIPKALYFIVFFLAQYLLLIVLRVILLATLPTDDPLLSVRIEWILLPLTNVVLLVFLNPLLFVTDYRVYRQLTS
ncbi:hypothetical protein HYV72_01670 [Candidatus Uhrbacteria bacterium]|nr:hypothetical protein [Candidatus Uhrbacteria bacterium]